MINTTFEPKHYEFQEIQCFECDEYHREYIEIDDQYTTYVNCGEAFISLDGKKYFNKWKKYNGKNIEVMYREVHQVIYLDKAKEIPIDFIDDYEVFNIKPCV